MTPHGAMVAETNKVKFSSPDIIVVPPRQGVRGSMRSRMSRCAWLEVQFTGAGPEGVVYGGPWAMGPSPRRVAPFALLHPDMHSAPPVSSRRSPGGTRIGRPPQWTVSRSRKLARMYVYTNLSIERIIKVLQNDVFRPRYSPQRLVTICFPADTC